MTDTDPARTAGGSLGGADAVDDRDPVPAALDWLVGAVVGLVGLALTAVGVGLFIRVDRAAIASAIAAEGTELNGLTPTEAVAAGTPFVDWLAIGTAASGLVALAGAVWFVRARRRVRDRVAREGGTTATFWACAVYGAAVTALTSFLPVAALLGGGTAAYLRGGEAGARVGAASGLVGYVLTVPMLAGLAVGLVAGGSAIGEFAGGVTLAGLVVVAQLVALAINAGLGAVGGVLAVRLAR